MSFDGIVTRAVTEEIKEKLLGGKLQKITQPSKNDLVLNIYSMGKSYKLLLSANNNEARINLTNIKYENPEVAPNFCMLLRKHLNHGKIVDIKQIGLDRIIVISISSIDEMGFDTSKKLVIELMGKYSNIILLNEKNIIIDSIKRVNESMSSIRQILPGLKYEFILDQKIDLTSKEFTKDIKYLDQKLADSTSPYKIFYTYYTGLSPVFGREICHRANIDPKINWGLVSEDEKNELNRLLYEYIDKINNNDFEFVSYESNRKIKDFYCFKLSHLNFDEEVYDSISQPIEKFYLLNKTNDRISQIKKDLIKKINSHIKSVNRKIGILEDNILKSSNIEIYKNKGDLLASNIYLMSKGMTEIEVDNYYNPGEKLVINLDPILTPWENVDSYYKRYKKIKNSIEFSKKDLPLQKQNLEYLKQLSDFIERADNLNEIDEIRSEMISNNLIKRKSKDKIKNNKSKPLHYRTIENSDIYVGKNSSQNDYITLKLANKNDYFFHVKDVAGSHVILKTDSISDNDIEIASYLAAINSSLFTEEKIDVDYTEKKNVNKPKGAKPGMVYYENFKTIRVDTRKDISDKYKKV